jgi:predicted outer membrane protein
MGDREVRGAGAVTLMVAALVGALGIAAACTPEDDGDFGSPETSLGAVDAPAGPLEHLAVTLTDENVIALLDTSYDALIELGGLAASKARDPRVRETISEALVRHRQMRQENLALARKIRARPKLVDDEPIEGHHEAMERLRMESGARFDRAYLAHTIGMHEALLQEVREALTMPVTVRVRDHLEREAATLETDLTRARELSGVLRGSGAGA